MSEAQVVLFLKVLPNRTEQFINFAYFAEMVKKLRNSVDNSLQEQYNHSIPAESAF